MPQTSPFPLIEVSGAPRERGRSYGEQARARIHGSIDLYVGSLSKRGLAKSEVQSMALEFAPRIKCWFPRRTEPVRRIISIEN